MLIFRLWIFLLLQGIAGARDFKLVGLHFPVGQPADNPAANVSVSEIFQGAQKRGFLRVALLPAIVAKNVEVRFLRPEVEALWEVRETLSALVKMEVQEWQALSLFVGQEKMPRLTAASAVPKGDVWALKGARFWSRGEECELGDCTLSVRGLSAGQLEGGKGRMFVRLDLGPAAR